MLREGGHCIIATENRFPLDVRAGVEDQSIEKEELRKGREVRISSIHWRSKKQEVGTQRDEERRKHQISILCLG